LIGFARVYQVRPIMATPRAAETIRPFAPDQISQTIALRSKLSPELPNGHWLIHRLPPLHNELNLGPMIVQRIIV